MKWLREPLVHFLLLGAGLFLLFGLVGREEPSRGRIVVTEGQIRRLVEAYGKTWRRQPTAKELEGLVDEHIREEIYYREALAMGLDRDDIIIRRRLRQKIEFFTEDLAAAVEPSEEALRDYLAEHSGRFRVADRVSFDQIYFNRDRRGEEVGAGAEAALARLRAGGDADPEQLGDSLLMPASFEDTRADEVSNRFGSAFARRIAELPVGEWEGPVESGYGLHLVRIRERIEGTVPPLEEIRDAVEREWSVERRAESAEAFYRGLRDRYEIEVESLSGEGVPAAPEGG